MKHPLSHKIDQLEYIAQSSKWKRLLYAPLRYIGGQLFYQLIYKNTRKGKLVNANTFFGTDMQVLLPAGMDIYLLGGKTHDSEVRLTRFMLQHLQEGNRVLDVGTHFGFYSLLASKLVSDSGRVIGVEASKAIFQIYNENTAAVKNLSPFHLAATETNGMVTFYEFPVLYSEYNTLSPGQFADETWLKKNPAQAIKVEGKKLDDLLAEEKVSPDFIKIDVEGAEDQVIKGLSATLQKASPLVALEYLADERENTPHQIAEDYLKGFGYQAHLIDKTGQLVPITDVSKSLRQNKIDSDNIIFSK